MNILQALSDAAVFGPHFRNREAWVAFCAALFGLPLSAPQLETFKACTGRATPPDAPCKEAWLVCGRRAGKSYTLALIAVFLASFRDWKPYLAAGERGTVMIIAADRKQARVIMRYVKGLLTEVPMLAATVEHERQEGIDLTNRISIEVHSCSFRSVRGYSVVASLCDEVAFWRSEESSNPDVEVINALRPAMATVPGAMLLCASSPYARRGALWNAYSRHYGATGDPILIWQAPTRVMNPTVPEDFIAEALADDAAHARAEYLAEFRTDVEAFLTIEAVEACTSPCVHERQPVAGTNYACFVDPSGGSSDSFTLAIGHKEDGKAVLDCIRETRPPFNPEFVVDEYVTLLKTYKVSRVTGDRYAGEWPREQFRKRGVEYYPASRPKSDLYLELLAPVNSGTVDLLDHAKLQTQLVGLERRTARGGKDSIDHGPGAHDDIANSVAGVLHIVLSQDPHATTTSYELPRLITEDRVHHFGVH